MVLTGHQFPGPGEAQGCARAVGTVPIAMREEPESRFTRHLQRLGLAGSLRHRPSPLSRGSPRLMQQGLEVE